MQRQPLQHASSRIASVGYDASSRTLEIEFVSGGTYIYRGVPQTMVDRLQTASSPGRFFDGWIKDRYATERIE